jgi:hypothetical protein
VCHFVLSWAKRCFWISDAPDGRVLELAIEVLCFLRDTTRRISNWRCLTTLILEKTSPKVFVTFFMKVLVYSNWSEFEKMQYMGNFC